MTDIRERFGAFDRLDMPDLWDDAQRREPRPAKGSGHSRTGKAIVIVAALALTIVTTGVMIHAFRHAPVTQPITGTSNQWPVGAVSGLGLSFSYPPEWRLQPFAGEIGTIYFQGMLISNTNLEFHHPDLVNEVTSAWDLSDLPSDGVVISIERVSGGPPPMPGPPPSDTPLPLDFSNAKLLAPQPDPFGSSPKPEGTQERYLDFVLNGHGDEIRVFFAPDASAGSRSAAAAVVASIGRNATASH
jgi:hypothetical protein